MHYEASCCLQAVLRVQGRDAACLRLLACLAPQSVRAAGLPDLAPRERTRLAGTRTGHRGRGLTSVSAAWAGGGPSGRALLCAAPSGAWRSCAGPHAARRTLHASDAHDEYCVARARSRNRRSRSRWHARARLRASACACWAWASLAQPRQRSLPRGAPLWSSARTLARMRRPCTSLRGMRGLCA